MQRFIFCRVLDIRVTEIVKAQVRFAQFPHDPLEVLVENLVVDIAAKFGAHILIRYFAPRKCIDGTPF